MGLYVEHRNLTVEDTTENKGLVQQFHTATATAINEKIEEAATSHFTLQRLAAAPPPSERYPH